MDSSVDNPETPVRLNLLTKQQVQDHAELPIPMTADDTPASTVRKGSPCPTTGKSRSERRDYFNVTAQEELAESYRIRLQTDLRKESEDESMTTRAAPTDSIAASVSSSSQAQVTSPVLPLAETNGQSNDMSASTDSWVDVSKKPTEGKPEKVEVEVLQARLDTAMTAGRHLEEQLCHSQTLAASMTEQRDKILVDAGFRRLFL